MLSESSAVCVMSGFSCLVMGASPGEVLSMFDTLASIVSRLLQAGLFVLEAGGRASECPYYVIQCNTSTRATGQPLKKAKADE